jgi:hypothetical protein
MSPFLSRAEATLAVILVVLPVPTPARSARSPMAPPSVMTLLEHLVGKWRMSGEVRGKPAEYRLDARNVLAARFVELHMLDTSSVAPYEARVFIGADTTAGRVIVHWLDSFGAAYSVPPGFGKVTGDTLRFELAYPTGTFRDTFVYDSRSDSWDITLLSRDSKNEWSVFAHYSARRS